MIFSLASRTTKSHGANHSNCKLPRIKSTLISLYVPPWFPHPCSGDEELNSLEGPCQLWGTVFYHLQFLSNTKLIYGASEMFFLFSLLTSTHLSSKVSLLSPTQTSFPVPDSLYLASFPPLQPRICVLMYKFILIIGAASASVFSWSFQRASVSCLSYSIQPLHWWPVGSF